jgi:hypothetical protein
MTEKNRRIGPIGSALRVLAGLAFIYLAAFAGDGLRPAWEVDPYEPVLGLVVFPAVMVAIVLAARRRSEAPLRWTGPVAQVVNLAVIGTLIVIDDTRAAAGLYYGASLLVAAWRAQPGCEITVVPNVILGRDDHIGCPLFWPVDEVEARLRSRGSTA